jgi:hypothetical protein
MLVNGGVASTALSVTATSEYESVSHEQEIQPSNRFKTARDGETHPQDKVDEFGHGRTGLFLVRLDPVLGDLLQSRIRTLDRI